MAKLVYIKVRSVILPIIFINIICFIVQAFSKDFTNAFLLNGTASFYEPWRFVTSMFLHGGFAHLFFNMYALFLFGAITEQRIGWKRFLFIYLLSGIIASIIGSFFYDAALGASGAIMGIIGVLIVLNPGLQLYMFFIIPMSLRTAGIIWVLLDSFGVFHPSGVANIAHLVGMACGLIYGLILSKISLKHKKRFIKTKDVLSDNEIDDYLKYGKI